MFEYDSAAACSTRSSVLPVQVEVQGIDSKAIKSTYTAFHTFKNGKTTLSCSGLLILPHQQDDQQPQQHQQGLVLAPMTCIYPFLQQSIRSDLSQASSSSLLPGVQISVLLRVSPIAAIDPTTAAAAAGPLHHLPATLSAALPLPYVAAAADQLLTSANGAGGGGWKFGWYLADQQPLESATSAMMAHVALLTVDLSTLQQQQQLCSAVVRHSLGNAGELPWQQQQQQQQQSCAGCTAGIHAGLPVAVLGSPFGCLAAHQFHGAVITGVISNVITSYLTTAGLVQHDYHHQQQQHSTSLGSTDAAPQAATAGAAAAASAAAAAARSSPPLFVVDGRCMPGMEGAAVSCRHCHGMLGILSVPLSNNKSQVELMMAVSIHQVAAALAAAAAAAGGGTGSSSSALIRQAYLALADCSSSGSSTRHARLSDTSTAEEHIQQQQQQQQRQGCNGSTIKLQPAYSMMQQQQPKPWPSQLDQSHHSSRLHTGSSSSSSRNSSSSNDSAACSRALSEVQCGVVMVRVGTSWGSGVIMTQSGLVMTNAHLFGGSSSSSSSNSSSSVSRHNTFASVRLTAPPCSNNSSGSSSRVLQNAWLPARLLYRFEGYLDIAILQIQHSKIRPFMVGAVGVTQQQQQQLDLLHPLRLAAPNEDVRQGDEVYVIGHGLFGPGMSWPPAVTGGCVARVVYRPTNNNPSSNSSSDSSNSSSSVQASMLISTAAVHGGASGGALVDAAGQLVGLVTSNARHVTGATLPHCNFCIAAGELRPIWQWAQQQQQQQTQQREVKGLSTPSVSGDDISPEQARDMLQQLKALDLKDTAGTRLWALLPPTDVGQQGGRSSSGAVAGVMDRLNQQLQSRRLLESKL